MGDVDGGDAEVGLQLGDVGPGLHPHLGVEVRQRLVHAEDLRVASSTSPGSGRGRPRRPAARRRPRARRRCGRARRGARARGVRGRRRACRAAAAHRGARVIALAELHVHLEATATPELVRRLAARNGLAIPPGTIDGDRYLWTRLPRLPAHLRPRRERGPHGPGLPRHHLRVPAGVRRGGRDLRRAHRLARPRRPAGLSYGDRSRASRRASTTRARRAGSRAGSSSPPCATSAPSAPSGSRARRPRSRTRTSPASAWPATRRGSRPGRSPTRSRSPTPPASASPATPASGPGRSPSAARWRCPGRSRGWATASAPSRTPRSCASSPSAAPCSRSARRPTWCSAPTRLPGHPFPVLRDAGVRVTLGSDDPPYWGDRRRRVRRRPARVGPGRRRAPRGHHDGDRGCLRPRAAAIDALSANYAMTRRAVG